MKAYPLIYSRTKNFDFVPDFLARPKDLDCQLALRYVKNAMSGLDFIQDIRYTVFSIGKYCICGGIACISLNLVAKLKKIVPDFASNYPDAGEYLKDGKGRPLACFIGIAVPKSEVGKGMIPDISLEQYWKVYLEYLKHQWLEKRNTSSEQFDFPPIDGIKGKKYVNNESVMKKETLDGRTVIINYAECKQQTLDYFFHAVLKGDEDDSFITEIQNQSDWNALYFKSAAVSESLYSALKKNSVNFSGLGSSLSGNRVAIKNDSGEVMIKKAPATEQISDTGQKKTSAVCSVREALFIVLLIVFLIAMFKNLSNIKEFIIAMFKNLSNIKELIIAL